MRDSYYSSFFGTHLRNSIDVSHRFYTLIDKKNATSSKAGGTHQKQSFDEWSNQTIIVTQYEANTE